MMCILAYSYLFVLYVVYAHINVPLHVFVDCDGNMAKEKGAYINSSAL